MKKKVDLNKLLNLPASFSEKFHKQTKIKILSRDSLDPKFWPESWKTVHFKAYSRLEEILLPKPDLLDKFYMKEALVNRKSVREFSKIPLSTNKLSTLLYYSAGLRKNKSPWVGNRFYPSAGARYPLEVYIVSLNTELPKGLYHYYLKNHSLESLLKLASFNYRNFFNQEWIKNTSCLILITAVFKRTTIKYKDRGYRHILTEAGHLGQNIYLVSTALDIGCCAIGGYADDKLNKLLDLDGFNEAVIYVLAVGTA